MNRACETSGCLDCRHRLLNVFSDLNTNEIQRLGSEKTTNIYKHNQILFYEGNHPSGLFCIFKGKIKIFKNGLEGREHIVRLAKEGDIVGYRALIGNEAYSSSAVAMEDSVVCFIPDYLFHEYLSKGGRLPAKIMELMFNELKRSERRAMELAQKPVRQRVAETLLLLGDFYGLNEDGRTVNSTLTRIDIASLSGAATETTIRFLSDFRDEHLIEFDGKKIILLDLEGLKREAEIYHSHELL
jgi:CRP/FNR family transcriptional regulator